jgi:hypothetical protein
VHLLDAEQNAAAHAHLDRWQYLCESCNTGTHGLVKLGAGAAAAAAGRSDDVAPRAAPTGDGGSGGVQPATKQAAKLRRAVLPDSSDEERGGPTVPSNTLNAAVPGPPAPGALRALWCSETV